MVITRELIPLYLAWNPVAWLWVAVSLALLIVGLIDEEGKERRRELLHVWIVATFLARLVI